MFVLELLTPSMNYIPVRKENHADSGGNVSSYDDVEDLDDQQFIVHGPIIHTAQNTYSKERTADKEVPLSSEDQALHDELVSLMHQESIAKIHNDAQRNAFEEENRRIALEKGKERTNSTLTISTANTPSQSTGNTPTDSDDDVPKEGVFSTNSFDNEHTDNEEDRAPDYNNMDHTIDVSSTPTLRIHKIHPQSQIIGKSTAGVLTRRKLKEGASVQHQALLSFIYKQNRTNHKDQQTCLFACFLSQEEPKKVSQALSDESWVEAMQEELLQFKLQDVWVLCDLPDGKRVIGTKWVFRNKRDERGTIIKNKARLVAQGYRQEDRDVDFDESFCTCCQIEANQTLFWHLIFHGLYCLSDGCQKRGAIDKTLFIKKDRRDIMLVQVYVDDIIFGSTKPSMVKDFEELMQKEFKMSSMGELTFFLGLQVKQTTAGLMIGFQVTSKVSTGNVKRIFRYLKHQPKLGLWYPKDSPFHLEAFSDSDYAGDNHDRRSTSGGCQYLGRRLVSWQCKKQTIVAISSTEAEYVAAASCCAQVLWMQNQLLDYGFNFMNTEIHIDNESTICIVKNPVLHSKTKHIQIRHHFIRDCYEQRLINVVKVHTDDNVADLLTKGFDLARFNFLVWKYLVHVLLHCLSPKSTSWEQFGTNIASALVGLATNQKFNFSLMIMNGMLGHIANEFLPSVRTLPIKVFTFMRKHSPKFSCRITSLTPPMLEVITALATEEAHSESTHSRAASSPRGLKVTLLKVLIFKVLLLFTKYAQLFSTHRRLRHLRMCACQKEEREKERCLSQTGENKDKEAAVTPDLKRKSDETEELKRKSDETEELERKSDETEQVFIEEKDSSDVKSGDTEELDLKEIQSLQVHYPSRLSLSLCSPEEQFKDDEFLADISVVPQTEWIFAAYKG
ncbi:ribonuclease H-like domain, reverse transcriptase, RNA-dependent DNA polymerase [Tanacetum coccineum]|uniref:Ribonuclease H-like domain, reverse transcriptase, RNA-dependent DNA polymerase n=1 Tax=Tanacetum coccineum TaxID=301880 RepID=A0ABQ5DI18_9ASTR